MVVSVITRAAATDELRVQSVCGARSKSSAIPKCNLLCQPRIRRCRQQVDEEEQFDPSLNQTETGGVCEPGNRSWLEHNGSAYDSGDSNGAVCHDARDAQWSRGI